MDFGERMKKVRLDKSLSLQAVADRLGTTRQNLSRYERNERLPKADFLQRYADEMRVSVDYLYGLTDDPQRYIRTMSPEEVEHYRIALMSVLFKDMLYYIGWKEKVDEDGNSIACQEDNKLQFETTPKLRDELIDKTLDFFKYLCTQEALK